MDKGIVVYTTVDNVHSTWTETLRQRQMDGGVMVGNANKVICWG